MELKERIGQLAIDRYRTITWVMIILTLGLGVLIPRIKVDTDPENMLADDEPVRLFHHKVKERFDISDFVVLGIVNNEHPEGVFNPQSLQNIYKLTQFAVDDPCMNVCIKEVDIIAPSEVDHIEQGGMGSVKFEWLMPEPPETQEGAVEVRERAMSNPMLKGTLVSEDGKAICLYLPLVNKDKSYTVYRLLNEKIDELKAANPDSTDQYHITGLPVAEDTFGVEMFIQMAVSAPLAMVTIFILMLLFFRSLLMVISPMIIAMVTVISTMGLLIGLGYPVHIMSSMIPIFLMPIAVVDSVHILSEFFDLYTPAKGRKGTILEVMRNLFTPMLYTSLTSAAGFASLALTPIPPVQVFGVFVAVGILLAWAWTILFVPAYIMFIDEKKLAHFGAGSDQGHEQQNDLLSRLLRGIGGFTFGRAKLILMGVSVLIVIAIYGISRIQINDNPVKWFAEGHPIRQADQELNEHFGGTYMAYLVLDDAGASEVTDDYVAHLKQQLDDKTGDLRAEGIENVSSAVSVGKKKIDELAGEVQLKKDLLTQLSAFANEKYMNAPDEQVDAWYELTDFFDLEKERLKVFKQPEVLRWMNLLQAHLETVEPVRADRGETTLVGKTNSVADVVRKVYQELTTGKEEDYRVPDSFQAVAQCLLQYQSSHNPEDLWHLVTSEYDSANIWFQLTSGDNMEMNKVVREVKLFIEDHPPPVKLEHHWAGLTYINTVWQDKMVSGMLQSFLGSFLVVFIMMTILFRSPLWGLLCMVPLTVTIALIYGIIGLIGKDYDMPVAVLSSLTLGMAVDFAIHFLERSRDSYRETGSWQAAVEKMFDEPARAISRNVLVIAIGFLPLLAAPLVPYKTVGIFLCSIMAASGTITLLALPSLLRIGEKLYFKPKKQPVSMTCNCGFCIIISIAAVLLIAINAHQMMHVGWNTLTWVSLAAIPVMALTCSLMSRRKACRQVAAES